MARKSRKHSQTEDCVSTNVAIEIPTYIYARISKDSIHAEDSIENQISICKEYINDHTQLTLGGTFTDLGFSGTDFDRPGYADMMAGISNGVVKCVAVKDLSRLGRSYIEVGELLFDTFVRYGIRFVSVNDRYDSFTDDADKKKLLIIFKNLINHMYILDISRKIKSGLAAKKQRCEPISNVPYGYCISDDGKRLEIDNEAAEIVKMIFDMRLQGDSIYQIARHLNSEKIPTPQNRRHQLGKASHDIFAKRIVWSVTFVSKILSNQVYTGALIQGKYNCHGKERTLLPKEKWVIHENAHEAIIIHEQFNAVALLLEEAAEKCKNKKQSQPSTNKYLGKVFCGRCGKAASRYSGNSVNALYYFCCRHCINDIKAETNLKRVPNFPMAKLDAAVMATLQKYMEVLVKFDNLEEFLGTSAKLKQKKERVANEKKEQEKIMKDAERNLHTAYTHHLEGLLDLREYQLVRTKIENDRLAAEAQLAKVCAEQAKLDINKALENQWLVKYRTFRDCKTPTKEMIQTLIGRIYLTPLTNELSIQLNFEDCFNELKDIMHEGGVTIDA